MSVLDKVIEHYDRVAFTTLFDVDKIIGTYEGEFTVPAPAPFGSTSEIQQVSTGIGNNCYAIGIYSYDGGITWNDMGAVIPDISTPSTPVFQTVRASVITFGGNIIEVAGENWYDNVHGVGVERTIQWKVVAVSLNVQGSITPQPVVNNKFLDTRDRNYQKIAMKGAVSYPMTSGAGQTATVTHGLGYIPHVRAFLRLSNATRWDPWQSYFIETRITETDLLFVMDSNLSILTDSGARIEYRIYYDV